ncbi:FAD-binding oxidoreductase [Enterococcus faecalis]|nr:FAD-binding oxidoreductase [Enterococcus faecalis]
MEKIAIIGGGIIGMTLANYLDTSTFDVALFDEGTGQATKASAGIISLGCQNAETNNGIVWLKTALLFPKLIKDFQLDQTIYAQSGTLLLRPEQDLAELAILAEKRKEEAPEIGNIEWLSPEQTSQALPLLKPAVSLRISGGGRLDGKAYLEHLGQRLVQKQIEQIQAKVTLHKKNDSWLVKGPFGEYTADRVILTPGPALKPLLKELGYSADIRPQKGQLLAFQTSYKMSQDWPVAMLDGEADFIPFMDGKILLGATHENDQGWDLAPTSEAYEGLTKSAEQFLADPDQIKIGPTSSV